MRETPQTRYHKEKLSKRISLHLSVRIYSDLDSDLVAYFKEHPQEDKSAIVKAALRQYLGTKMEQKNQKFVAPECNENAPKCPFLHNLCIEIVGLENSKQNPYSRPFRELSPRNRAFFNFQKRYGTKKELKFRNLKRRAHTPPYKHLCKDTNQTKLENLDLISWYRVGNSDSCRLTI